MSTEQPEALRLAKELVLVHQGHADEGPSTFSEAAAELRRVHAVNAQMLKALQMLIEGSQCCGEISWCGDIDLSPWERARAAIEAASKGGATQCK